MRTITIIVSIFNMVIALALLVSAMQCIRMKHEEYFNPNIIAWVAMAFNLTFLGTSISLLNSIFNSNIRHVRRCLEVFVVLFVLNVIPMGLGEPEYEPEHTPELHKHEYKHGYERELEKDYEHDGFVHKTNKDLRDTYDKAMAICQIFYVIVVLEIYLVYRYHDHAVERTSSSVLAAPRGNPASAPAEQQYHMASVHSAAALQPYPTQQPAVQYVAQQAELQYSTQPPVNQACSPSPAHTAKTPAQYKNPAYDSMQDLLSPQCGQSAQSVAPPPPCNPPPYSMSKDM